MKTWATINIILKALDLATTYYYVNIHGTIREANPIIRFVYNNVGLFCGSIFIFMLFVFLAYTICKKGSLITMYIVCALLSLVVINNFYHIFSGG